MSKEPVFLADINALLAKFAKSRKVGPEKVQVRLTLADGHAVTFRGFQTTASSDPNGWGMVQGFDDAPDALLIRAEHVIAVECQVEPLPEPEPDGKFGFNR